MWAFGASSLGSCRRCWLAALVFCGLGVAADSEQSFPPCRKSVELHALKTRAVDAEGGASAGEAESSLFFFGGKGYTWQAEGKKGGKGGKGKHHRKGKGHKKKKGGLKQEVQFFGMEDMWQFVTGPRVWHDTDLEGSRAPSQRWKFAAATFDDDAKMALFGGCASANIRDVLQDLWVFETTHNEKGLPRGQWRLVPTQNPPAARRGHVVAASSTHLVVFGGKTYVPGSGPLVLTDLWSLPLEALRGGSDKLYSWTQGASIPTQPRWGSTGTVLAKPNSSGEVLGVFGGRVYSGDAGGYTYFNDLWLYDFGEDSWSNVHPPEPAPKPRDHHGAAALNGELYVFGGRAEATKRPNATLGDVWSYSLNTGRWSEHPKVGDLSPAPRFMPGVAHVDYNGETALAVAGGELLPGSTKKTTLNDVWVYLPRRDGGWRLLSPAWCGPEAFPRYALPEPSPDTLSALLHGHNGLAALVLLFAGASVMSVAGVALSRRLRAERQDEESPYLVLD